MATGPKRTFGPCRAGHHHGEVHHRQPADVCAGGPGYIRSDNGPEFIAKVVQDWIAAVGSTTVYIEPGSPWENGYCESFNAKLRGEFLNGEAFYSQSLVRQLPDAS